ncbi:hypothetical protein LPB140_02895 [Sphingorhabdus lutea]|uniref:MobA-like NTP transferase domain-containing protein n=2 Tax=Sphingorhabdus lutea TaxID=1913578 RepID=A0A1L3JED1_9SPHN|nr:hypothetical protein LPB140_02895 [Sphingorhabdus lutea]
MIPQFDAILLAGSRPEIDPLAHAANVSLKSLVMVHGRPMLSWPLRHILSHPQCRKLCILAQDFRELLQHPQLKPLLTHPKAQMCISNDGISSSIADILNGSQLSSPILILTGDNVLINDMILDEFLQSAKGNDLAVGMVEKRTMMAKYPDAKRTWIKLRGGAWSGANLFWIEKPAAMQPLLSFWQDVEQKRKKGLAIIAAFGPFLMIGAAARFWTMGQAIAKAGRRFGLRAALAPINIAEACIDVDKPADLIQVEAIMASDRQYGP